MSHSEKFCLKWNDFQTNIETSYRELRNDMEFADVTLVCEENQKIEAHRIILSSASKTFKDMLKGNTHSHPLIYMRQIRAEDMLSAVDFIYQGEVNIEQERLDDFLALAEELKLKGLSGSKEIIYESPVQNLLDKEQERKARPKENLLDSPDTKLHVSKSMVESIKEEKLATTNDNTVSLIEESAVMEAKTSVSYKGLDNIELDEKISLIIQKVSGVWTCTVCGKNAKTPYLIKRHAEIHIEGVSHPCGHCGKIFRSRNNLQVHIFRNHTIKTL